MEVRIYMEAFYLENFHELDYVKGILMLNLNGAHVSLVAVMYKVSCVNTLFCDVLQQNLSLKMIWLIFWR